MSNIPIILGKIPCKKKVKYKKKSALKVVISFCILHNLTLCLLHVVHGNPNELRRLPTFWLVLDVLFARINMLRLAWPKAGTKYARDKVKALTKSRFGTSNGTLNYFRVTISSKRKYLKTYAQSLTAPGGGGWVTAPQLACNGIRMK